MSVEKLVAIVDLLSPDQKTVRTTEIASAVQPWFAGCDQKTLDIIDTLQDKVCRGEYSGEEQAYLQILIRAVEK
jgi:hypothetical protein